MDSLNSRYVALTPQNVVSVIKTGKQTDILKNKEITVYTSFASAVQNCPELKKSKTGLNQIYVFELYIPQTDQLLLDAQSAPSLKEEYFTCTKLNPKWIVCAKVANLAGQNLLSRLFNGQPDFEIFVCKSDFEAVAQPKSIKAEEEKKKELDSTAPLLGSPPITTNFLGGIIKREGDLLGSKMQTLVNTVNCVGVMGKGIALSFKMQYPKMFKDYQSRCKQKKMLLGEPYLYRESDARWIINFPTKNHWRHPSQLDWIEQGLRYLRSHLKEWGVTSLALPPLGCGNGGLPWSDVEPLIYKYLTFDDIPVEIYTPFAGTDHKKERSVKNALPSLGKRQRDQAIAPNAKKMATEKKVNDFFSARTQK